MSELLKTAEGVATIIIALYVASIGTFQWITSREKLRLDLYNRRFDLYLRTLDFIESVVGWENLNPQDRFTRKIAFHRVIRESRFLFNDDPSITRFLMQISTRADGSLRIFETGGTLTDLLDPKGLVDPDSPQSHFEWLVKSGSRLEPMLVPYLAFGHRAFRSSVNQRKSTEAPLEPR